MKQSCEDTHQNIIVKWNFNTSYHSLEKFKNSIFKILRQFITQQK